MSRLTDIFKNYEEDLELTLNRTRLSNKNPGAKGDAIEDFVKDLILNRLPRNCKIAPGYVVCADNPDELGTLYDIVIYNTEYCGPLAKMGVNYIFPFECVLGVIEVTSFLDKKKLEMDVLKLTKLRQMEKKHFYLAGFSVNHHIPVYIKRAVPPRCCMFAADTDMKKEAIAKNLQVALVESGDKRAHIHQLYVNDRGCFRVKPRTSQTEPYFDIQVADENNLLFFVNELAVELARFPLIPTGNDLMCLLDEKTDQPILYNGINFIPNQASSDTSEKADIRVEGKPMNVDLSGLYVYPNMSKYGQKTEQDYQTILNGIVTD